MFKQFFDVLPRAHEKKISGARQHDDKEKICKIFLLLRPKATTPIFFTFVVFCCYWQGCAGPRSRRWINLSMTFFWNYPNRFHIHDFWFFISISRLHIHDFCFQYPYPGPISVFSIFHIHIHYPYPCFQFSISISRFRNHGYGTWIILSMDKNPAHPCKKWIPWSTKHNMWLEF